MDYFLVKQTSLTVTVDMYLRFLSTMTNTIQKQKLFLSSPYYAVVGASTDQSKFGTKVLLVSTFIIDS
jgi:hypothetical protein